MSVIDFCAVHCDSGANSLATVQHLVVFTEAGRLAAQSFSLVAPQGTPSL